MRATWRSGSPPARRSACSRSPPAPVSSRARWRDACPPRPRSSPPTSTRRCSRRAARIGTARPVEWRQADAMAAAVRRRIVRRRRLPVRRHVLSRQGEGVRRGAPRAQARRGFPVQRLGPDRRQRIRRRRHRRGRGALPRRPAAIPARALRTATTTSRRSSATCARAASTQRRGSRRSLRAAWHRRHAIRRSPSAKGTPLRSEIEARGTDRLGEAVDASEAAIARRFGSGPVDAKMQAHIVTVER